MTCRAFPASARNCVRHLARLIGGETWLDLIFHLPTSWIDRRNRASIDTGPRSARSPPSPASVDKIDHARLKFPARVRLRDDTGFITLTYFHANRQWLEKTFEIGKTIIASGKVGDYQGGRQIVHPDHIADPEKDDDLPEVEPVYPMTANITPKQIRKFVAAALDGIPDLDEWIDPAPDETQRVARLQAGPAPLAPAESLRSADGFEVARNRLAYDEALAREMAMGQARLARERRHARADPARSRTGKTDRRRPSIQADARPDECLPGCRHRHEPPHPHAPHDPGRCRLRQNAGRRARRSTGRSRRRRHRLDVAHRSPRAPAGRGHRPLPRAPSASASPP